MPHARTTATDDDTYPGIYLWDLRSSTQTPLTKFEGHRAGVLSIDWSPHDPNLLMSAAKDNQTFMWDLKSRAPTYTLPDVAPAGGAESFDLLAGAGGKRFDVQWSRHLPGLLCACSFSRKVCVWVTLGWTPLVASRL